MGCAKNFPMKCFVFLWCTSSAIYFPYFECCLYETRRAWRKLNSCVFGTEQGLLRLLRTRPHRKYQSVAHNSLLRTHQFVLVPKLPLLESFVFKNQASLCFEVWLARKKHWCVWGMNLTTKWKWRSSVHCIQWIVLLLAQWLLGPWARVFCSSK